MSPVGTSLSQRSGADVLADELARLAGLDATRLRSRWRKAVGRSLPDRLAPSLILRALAYRVQADALGGLDRETERALARLASGATQSIPLPERRPTKPGTIFVREWAGVHHHVMALDQGYAWEGRTYESLSKAAHAITGTKWNGPRFFGLRAKGSRPPGSAAK